MTYHGTVKDGRIELDAEAELPEGARVTIELEELKQAAADLKALLQEYAGCAGDGLPEDLAEQHDHYLYGTPKR